MFIKIQIKNQGLEGLALFWPLKKDLQDSLKFDVPLFINKDKGLRGVYLDIQRLLKIVSKINATLLYLTGFHNLLIVFDILMSGLKLAEQIGSIWITHKRLIGVLCLLCIL
jgi:hypothetical protein